GELAGASLEDVKISAVVEGRKVVATGPMMFTDDGIGGPAVLDLSRLLTDYLPNDKAPIEIYVDMMPGVSESELDKQVREQIIANPKKTVAGILAFFLPKRVATILCEHFNFDAGLLGSELKKDARKRIVRLLKALPLSVVSTRPIDEAIVTRGGVSIEQVQSKTMESKISPGLFFAGEVLDVDGPCGGYNLQMCWSTGALAGCEAAEDR
ncbi:MAG: aminoacetone oxidase family FAD-binding enzyme, partial [Sedimentisphaerales bacterium]|nr:aminoacetone oxidase family FAD-binding enzyme [Sedimentisphaerales bacterium]